MHKLLGGARVHPKGFVKHLIDNLMELKPLAGFSTKENFLERWATMRLSPISQPNLLK